MQYSKRSIPATTMATFMSAKFETYKEYREATLALIQGASHSLMMYERDFSQCGLESRAMTEAMAALLARNPAAQIRILAHSTEFIASQCPLLLELENRQNQRLQMHLANPDMPALFSPFILADMQRFVRRCHFDWPKSECADDARDVAKMRQAFDKAWECSNVTPDWRRLDL
ncbi:hypothetical protein [Silvimonas sp.]|nr:hypothetical protein [Silvimonas sp.]MDR3428860.1 hypothetical protein [Silvimonas sp.]